MYALNRDIIKLEQWSLSRYRTNAPILERKREQRLCTVRSVFGQKRLSSHFRLCVKRSSDAVKHKFAAHQSTSQADDSSRLATLKDVECWLTQLYVNKDSYPPAGIPLLEFLSRFEQETSLHLDPTALGESTFLQVLRRFTHLVRVKTVNIPGKSANYSNVFRSKMAMSSGIKEDALLEACKHRGVVSAPLSATSPTSVWWDIENCGIPKGTSATQVSRSIQDFFLHHQVDGPAVIQAFGYMPLLPSEVRESLLAEGILLHSVPKVCKDAGDKALLEGLLTWALAHPPPVRVMVISGDHYFYKALTTLQSLGYCIIMVHPLNAARKLREVSALTVDWSTLATGADISALCPPLQSPPVDEKSGADKSTVDGKPAGAKYEAERNRARDVGKAKGSKYLSERKHLATLETLRNWMALRVPEFWPSKEGVAIEIYVFLFETEMRQKVDPIALGYKSLSELYSEFPDLVRVKESRGQARLVVVVTSSARGDPFGLDRRILRDNMKGGAYLPLFLDDYMLDTSFM